MKTSALILLSAAALLLIPSHAGASARRGGGGSRTYQFEATLGKGAYDSEVTLQGGSGCTIVQDENDKFSLTADYPVSIPNRGSVGHVKQDAVNSGGSLAWHLQGSQRGCTDGNRTLSDCSAADDDVKLNPKKEPELTGTEHGGKLDLQIETISAARVLHADGFWDHTNNGGSCGDAYDGTGIFYPAGLEPDGSSYMPQMLSMRVSVSLRALGGLKRGQRMSVGSVHVAASDHPPLGCSGSFGEEGTCSEHVKWDGKVVAHRIK